MRRAFGFIHQARALLESNARQRSVFEAVSKFEKDCDAALRCRCAVFSTLTCSRALHLEHKRTYKRQNGKSVNEAMTLSKILAEKKTRAQRIRQALELRQTKLKKDVEDALLERRMRLTNTGRQIRARGKLLIQDIKETKNKMKEKMEEVIERENVYTIPNLLCLTRIMSSPLLGYFIICERFNYALVFMAFAGVSDWVDGFIARNYPTQSSKIGSFLDPMADKVLIGTLFLCLTYVNLIPVPLTALIIGRDVVLVTAGFVIRYRSLPPPRTLSRYFDVTLPTAQLAPTFISKVNTGVQLALVASTLAAPVFGYVDHPLLHVLWYVTGASTILAAASYISSKETYRYLKPEKRSKRK